MFDSMIRDIYKINKKLRLLYNKIIKMIIMIKIIIMIKMIIIIKMIIMIKMILMIMIMIMIMKVMTNNGTLNFKIWSKLKNHN